MFMGLFNKHISFMAVLITTILAATTVFAQTESTDLLWSVTSDGIWTANNGSIGDHGTRAFRVQGVAYAKVCAHELSESGENPIWCDDIDVGEPGQPTPHVNDAKSRSAKKGNYHVATYFTWANEQYSAQHRVLRLYESDTPTPVWTYVSPLQDLNNARFDAAISDSGNVIVLVEFNPYLARTVIRAFHPQSSIPFHESEVDTFLDAYHFNLSADGDTVLLSNSNKAIAYSLSQGLVTFEKYFFHSNITSQSVSGDGSKIAFGFSGAVEVYQNDDSHDLLHALTLDSGAVAKSVALSKNGKALAAGATLFPLTDVQIKTWALPSEVLLLEDWVMGEEVETLYYNDVHRLIFSANGSILAAGLFGDQNQTAPNLRLYNTRSGTLIDGQFGPGSILDLDFSADGRFVLANFKDGHANDWGGGGEVRCIEIKRSHSN